MKIISRNSVTTVPCLLLIVSTIVSCADDKKTNYHIDEVDSVVVDAGDESESENENESETNSDYVAPSDGGYTPSPTPMPMQGLQNEPRRDQCRACNGTGACPVCNGNGQTHTKRVYNYDLGCYDLDWETCNTCGGSGRHDACGGDGWLDEGVDF